MTGDEGRLALTIDGRALEVPAGTTLWEAARTLGIEIPVLCHRPDLRPVGVCRVCLVEVEGARVLQAACVRQAEEGMVVRTNSSRVVQARRMVLEMLLADYSRRTGPDRPDRPDELLALARAEGIREPRLPGRAEPLRSDGSSPVIQVEHGACILCDRCIRACDEIQCNDVIGRAGKGYQTRIAFDDDRPMGESSCVACGECAAACPTGALVDHPPEEGFPPPERSERIDSLCPYCGVGCAITYQVDPDANRIIRAEGRESPVSHGRLCVKGRYGFDYTHHPDRLTVPLIRRDEAHPKPLEPPRDPRTAFREATWDEALDLTARRLLGIRDTHGPSALAGFGSAKGSNEDAYVFQKLVRAVFGTNNVDHCTRLCHASSVAALVEQIGSGSVSNPFSDCGLAEVILVTGSNTTENHPVAATFIKQAARAGSTLIVVDPRRVDLVEHAHLYLPLRPETDVAFYNAVMHVILAEGLQDDGFIAERTEGLDALRKMVEAYPPERAAEICGVPAETIRRVARIYGWAERAMIFWGMGIAQHTTGTNNARCLINLALLTGNIGRDGVGLHPLRGQNNVQGASDVGLIPMFYPGYQDVTDPEERRRFEQAWGVELDPEPGLTVVEILDAARAGRVRGMYMLGENPLLSDPDTAKVQRSLASLDFLVVQDIFLTETAAYADVILPATSFFEKSGTFVNTDSRAQLGRQVLRPPGQARSDWRITCELARRMGYPMEYADQEEIWREVTDLTPPFECITYDRMAEKGIPWPCDHADHHGTLVRFTREFPRGRGRFAPAEYSPPVEPTDPDYPLVLNTGRQLEHWHTGTMTRRSRVLHRLAPEARVELHPADLDESGLEEGQMVRVSSRRGSIQLRAVRSHRPLRGSCFIPFHFAEAAANRLTLATLDPDGKIPGFKHCAVRVEAVDPGAPFGLD